MQCNDSQAALLMASMLVCTVHIYLFLISLFLHCTKNCDFYWLRLTKNQIIIPFLLSRYLASVEDIVETHTTSVKQIRTRYITS